MTTHPSSIKPIGATRIVVRRQRGHGFWATIYEKGKPTRAIQSGSVYGFSTALEARTAALATLK